jgi:tripartite-type tricarboxylate transporter receptor subunit TctC
LEEAYVISALVRRALGVWFGLLACASSAAFADWPEKPVKIIVPYVSGAMGDVVSRLLAEELRSRLGQAVIVENKPGAGGNIGTAAVAQAPADGYTLLVAATNNFVINQFLYRSMSFDPLAALEPVTILVDVPSVIFINANVPATSFQEFASFARANRGKVNYGSPGSGTTPHLSAELINRANDLGLTHVAYKGASQAITALLANDVQMYLVGAGLGLPHVKAGKLHAIAVSSRARLAVLPDMPTFEEVGLRKINASNWWAIAGPRALPKEVIDKLHAAIKDWLASPTTQARFQELGVVSVGKTPAETKAQLAEEARYWQRAVREIGAQID